MTTTVDTIGATARAATLRALSVCFAPTAVAVVGAGRDGGVGAAIVENLAATFRGRTLPINPHAAVIGGLPCYPSVASAPRPVDLAVIAVPAPHVEEALDDCIAANVPAAVVITAGFSETGAAGRAREIAIRDKARRAGMRLIGPNCLGIINADPGVQLNASFAAALPPPGRVAFASQSGALGLAVMAAAGRAQIGISQFVSTGNSIDLSFPDLLDYWAADPATGVILLYAESLDEPRRLLSAARPVARTKPIVALKSGRSVAGARAASSHTGALACNDALVDALFQEAGILRARSIDDLLNTAAVLAHQPLPRGGRIAILTNAGGPAILAADACGQAGLTVAALSPDTTRALRAFLPPQASVGDPVDMIATASPADYGRAIPLLLDDDGVDALIVVCVRVRGTDIPAVARTVAAATEHRDKPVVATFLGAEGVGPLAAPVPCYAFPEAAVAALGQSVRYAAWRAQPEESPADGHHIDRRRSGAIVAHGRRDAAGWLAPDEVSALLEACGIPVATTRMADSRQGAVTAARDIGYPVVLKGFGPALLHKTESHAVHCDLQDEAALLRAFASLEARRDVERIVVQPMVSGGVEMFVGCVRDEAFGHAVVCGSGGILVEWLNDVARRLVPVTPRGAAGMIDGLRGAIRLRGFRGSAPLDEAALRDVILAVSALAEACPAIAELDLNPIVVQPAGAIVVDARIRIG
jgi:acetyl coenzyme A synthetase (ADP forming)-like protein